MVTQMLCLWGGNCQQEVWARLPPRPGLAFGFLPGSVSVSFSVLPFYISSQDQNN